MNSLFRLITGFYRICFFSPKAERILNFVLEKNIPVWHIGRQKESISLSISPFHMAYFRPFLDSLSPEERIEKKEGGSLRLWTLFGKRLGFFAGLGFFFISLYVSTLFVWGVEIYGNESIHSEVIRSELAEKGLSPGALLSRLDLKELALRYQIESDRFVYVNINPIGTKAYVEVREREGVERTVEEEGASNLVADFYGTVVRYEVLDGQIEVKKGDHITQGTLLISGVKETKTGSFFTVRARGRVFAETQRSFEVTIPFEQTEKVFTGEEKVKKSYEFLGLTLSSPFPSLPDSKRYEKLEIVEDATFFGLALPLRVREEIFLETEEKKEIIEVDRAEKLAYDKYEQYKRDIFADGDEILAEDVAVSRDETGVTLSVSIRAVEDICKEVPFQCVTSPS